MILPKKSQKHLASFDSFLYNTYVADKKRLYVRSLDTHIFPHRITDGNYKEETTC